MRVRFEPRRLPPKTNAAQRAAFVFGGDGGDRTRVRKSSSENLYTFISQFNHPRGAHEQAHPREFSHLKFRCHPDGTRILASLKNGAGNPQFRHLRSNALSQPNLGCDGELNIVVGFFGFHDFFKPRIMVPARAILSVSPPSKSKSSPKWVAPEWEPHRMIVVEGARSVFSFLWPTTPLAATGPSPRHEGLRGLRGPESGRDDASPPRCVVVVVVVCPRKLHAAPAPMTPNDMS